MSRNPQDSLQIEEGDRLRLSDGSVVEVTANPRDGVWLFCTYLSSDDASLVGATEQPVYGSDVVGFVEED